MKRKKNYLDEKLTKGGSSYKEMNGKKDPLRVTVLYFIVTVLKMFYFEAIYLNEFYLTNAKFNGKLI